LPVGYYLLIHSDCLQLLRIGYRTNVLIAEQVGNVDHSAIETFVDSLRKTGKSPIIPIAVLIDGPRCFVAGWRDTTFSREQIVQHATSVRHEAAEIAQTLAESNGTQIFLIQGIQREFLDALRQVLKSRNVATLFIGTLVGYTLLSNLKKFSRQQFGVLCSWSERKVTFIGINHKGGLFSGAFLCGDTRSVAEKSNEVERLFSHSEVEMIPVSTYSPILQTHKQSLQVNWLTSRPMLGRPASTLQYSLANSATARCLYVALGSLKLLNLIGCSILLASLAWFGFSAAFLSSDEAAVRKYQQFYSNHLMLQTQVDSLARQTRLTDGDQSAEGTSALLSALCQETVPGATLTGVLVRPQNDSAYAEISGTAQDDIAAFDLLESMRRMCGPLDIQVSSIRPEAIMQDGLLDTLMAFKFTVTRGGQ
jgi:hypothetical protein